MKFYGQPRLKDIENPDLVDISKFGLKSSKSRCKSKSGDIKNSFRNSDAKRTTRRIWKKKERQHASHDISKELCY